MRQSCHSGGLWDGARSLDGSSNTAEDALSSPRRPDRDKTVVMLLKEPVLSGYECML